MAKAIEWPEFPLIGATRNVPVTEADITAVLSLFPECDPSNPPWNEIEAELLSAGYHLHDIMNVRYQRLFLMLRQFRAATECEWETDFAGRWAKRFGVSGRTFSRWKHSDKFRVDEARSNSKTVTIHRDDVRRLEKLPVK